MPGEVCDDAAPGDMKGCKDCTGFYPGYECSGGSPTEPSDCWEVCGDNILTESEECEDKNMPDNIGTVGGDGCSADCLLEGNGWICTHNLNFPTAPYHWSDCEGVCGDG